jgi:hypothetical protein
MKLFIFVSLLISSTVYARNFAGNFAPKNNAYCGYHIEEGENNMIVLESIDNRIAPNTCGEYEVLLATCRGNICQIDGRSEKLIFLPDGNMVYSGNRGNIKSYRY